MKKVNRIIVILSILIFLLCVSSAVYAEDTNKGNITQSNDDTTLELQIEENLSSDIDNEKLEADDSIKNYIVNQRNFKMYFDDHNILKDEYGGQIITFDGKFNDKGIVTIGSPNTKVTGRNTLFNNTVFCLEATNITLSNLNFVLDKTFPRNDYAGILVLNDNITVYNCNIDYTVPKDCDGTGIYVECGSYDKVNGVNLINNTINIIGNNIDDGAVYGIFVDYTDNAVIYGNKIDAQLPLKAVDWSREIYGGARVDTVAAFAAQKCENMTITNNTISTKANHRGDVFPTIDTVILHECPNAVIEGNYIYSEDYVTKEGEDNYLYALDMYISDNVTVIANQIHIRTSGGSEIMGTAYPIQVTGPCKDVKIAYNNISSVNNGPNLGIYSQNFYGPTEIQVISNFINVSGVANKHYWALVAGIEVQDSRDLIWNNTIIVNNLGDYDDDNNIYGISYSQNTNNNHSYNIQYNKVITNGRYAVSLAGTTSLVVDSVIANNMFRTSVSSGDDAVRIGNGTNNQVFNNGEVSRSMNHNDLPDWIKNHRTVKPVNPQFDAPEGITLYFDNDNTDTTYSTPGHRNSNNYGVNGNQGNQNSGNKIGIGVSNNTNKNSDFVKGEDDGTASKIGGETTSAQPSSSPSNTGIALEDGKAYEITKQIKKPDTFDEYIKAILLCLVALLLLIAGYKRQDKKEEKKY